MGVANSSDFHGNQYALVSGGGLWLFINSTTNKTPALTFLVEILFINIIKTADNVEKPAKLFRHESKPAQM